MLEMHYLKLFPQLLLHSEHYLFVSRGRKSYIFCYLLYDKGHTTKASVRSRFMVSTLSRNTYYHKKSYQHLTPFFIPSLRPYISFCLTQSMRMGPIFKYYLFCSLWRLAHIPGHICRTSFWRTRHTFYIKEKVVKYTDTRTELL